MDLSSLSVNEISGKLRELKSRENEVISEVVLHLSELAKRALSRHVPVAVRDEVHLRDKGQCTFCGPDGRRCPETKNLQIDHVRPWAMGGGHETENLRLLCPAHNRLLAERLFGKEGPAFPLR